MNRDMNSYISFLNTNDWSLFHRSQPATWADPFRPNNQASGDIADIFSDDTMDSQLSGLDVYDPIFEKDLNEFTDGSGTTEEDFWFTADGQTPSDTHESADNTSKSDLLKRIKQHELTK